VDNHVHIMTEQAVMKSAAAANNIATFYTGLAMNIYQEANQSLG